MIEVPNLRRGYIEVRDAILRDGKRVSPRGYPTWEIINATIRIEDALDVLPIGVNRDPRLAIAAAEAIQLIGGFAAPDMMTSISSEGFSRFLSGGVFHGAYGPRVRLGVRAAERALRADPDSRQGVVTVFQSDDLHAASQEDPPPDIPCTKDLHFMIRDGKLIVIANMRSNDFWKGLAYDAFQFTQLQASLARSLGLEVGPYYHHADSLHIYESDMDRVEDLHVQYSWPTSIGGIIGVNAADFQARARRLYTGVEAPMTDSEQWYTDLLRPYAGG